ncbi:MAG TPA: cob(I)yrinic acid a,c-diamide adenosyltransferase [Geobacterales bacterium]|nr:cob(I)yrinic acid a,c-diamide adenosyltransferase [Geobacterales bacterium]
MRFYTRTGDEGETGLMHGKRVSKDYIRIECLGDLDELSSFIGFAVSKMKDEILKDQLIKIQRIIYLANAEIADPTNKTKLINEEHLKELEKDTDDYSTKLEPLKHFIIPGGGEKASIIHICRSICRRAERSLVKLNREEKINPLLLKYFNRLSSFFFVLALYLNKIEGIRELEAKMDG